ncbi:MAG: glycosyltransferase family 4 protein [Kiritimatiellae bacterium]|nr:glycosyltransferase family 4 protein [Kiritimatiellia bacterium]
MERISGIALMLLACPHTSNLRIIDAVRILTNMAFWQSQVWTRKADSLYDTATQRDPDFMPWWREAIALWRRAPRYDVIVTMGVRESMLYGLLCALTFRRPKQIMCEVFIDAPRPTPSWHLKNLLYRFVARRAIGLLANSSAEVHTIARRYQLDPARIRYVPLNSNIANPQMESADDGFILSAGRTLRDYATLLNAVRQLPELPTSVICGRNDFQGLEIPPHVQIFTEIPRATYLEKLRRCRLVALPLLNTERATGQVVMLEAMAMGKPVITTRSPGTVDHLVDGENGILIEPGDAPALAREIERLWNNPALRQRLGEAAVHTMRESASADRHAELKLRAIAELNAQQKRH